jgi:hypothetical protein
MLQIPKKAGNHHEEVGIEEHEKGKEAPRKILHWQYARKTTETSHFLRV